MRTAILLSLMLSAAAASAADGTVAFGTGNAEVRTSVRSVKSIREHGVVMQTRDYSCGAASLATLLTYGLGEPTDEDWVLQQVFDMMTPEQQAGLVKKGLSLLDMQKITLLRGLRGQGFRIGADQLAKLTRPVIAFVKPNGNEHFVVIKGVRGDRIHLADPSLGNVRMPLYRFMDMWADESGRGVVFAVDRLDGQWPETYALQQGPYGGQPLEVLTARDLFEVGKPYPPNVPPPFAIR